MTAKAQKKTKSKKNRSGEESAKGSARPKKPREASKAGDVSRTKAASKAKAPPPAKKRFFLLRPFAWVWRFLMPAEVEWRSLGFPILAAVFWGLVTRLGYAPFDWVFAGMAGFAGFLWFFAKQRRYMTVRCGFWLGALYGFVFYYSSCLWLNSLRVVNPLAPLGIPFVGALEAFWAGVFGAGLAWVAKNRPNHVVLFAALWWTLAETGRSVGALAFPFFMLGHLGARHPQFLFRQDAFMYSFLIAGGCAAVAVAFNRWWASAAFEGPRSARSWLASVAVLAAALGWSVWVSRGLDGMTGPDSPRLKFAAVQPNIKQSRKLDSWHDAALSDSIKNETLSLALSLKPGEADLVLFPEATFPGRGTPLFLDDDLGLLLMVLSKQLGAGVIAGDANIRDEQLFDPSIEFKDYFNACWLIRPDDMTFPRSRVYEKRQLAPFGEHMPLIGWIPGAQDLFGIGIWTAATEPAPLPLTDQVNVGPLICFETAMSGLAYESVQAGANVLAAPSNVAWFGETSGMEHHFVHAVFRAFETGVPVIQAGNTGVTSYIDPSRRLIAEPLPRRKPGVLKGEMWLPSIEKAKSVTRLSPGPLGWLGLCLTHWVAMIALWRRDRRREKETTA